MKLIYKYQSLVAYICERTNMDRRWKIHVNSCENMVKKIASIMGSYEAYHHGETCVVTSDW